MTTGTWVAMGNMSDLEYVGLSTLGQAGGAGTYDWIQTSYVFINMVM